VTAILPKLTIRGVDHYYEWVTTDPNNQRTHKPVMVFVHGWGGSARYWQGIAAEISSCYDCLLYDLRGFGRSICGQHPTAAGASRDESLLFELEAYADDLAELIQQFQIAPVTVHSHSMGASIALYFANRHPHLLNKLILACSGIFEYDERAFAAFYKFGRYVVMFRPSWLKRIPFANRFFMARFLHRSLPDSDSQAFLEDFLIADEDAAMGTIFASVSKRATEVMPLEFQNLANPTLLISGQYDQIIPATLGRSAAQLNDRLQYVEILNTGHFPMLEDAPRYLEVVGTFLESH
jgi:pimeloyl-ACP methyl ester carboxylesterase